MVKVHFLSDPQVRQSAGGVEIAGCEFAHSENWVTVRQTVWSSPNTYTYNFRKKTLKLINKNKIFFWGVFLQFFWKINNHNGLSDMVNIEADGWGIFNFFDIVFFLQNFFHTLIFWLKVKYEKKFSGWKRPSSYFFSFSRSFKSLWMIDCSHCSVCFRVSTVAGLRPSHGWQWYKKDAAR